MTDDDCIICHYEGVDSAFHQNGTVDLRDPDDGTASTLISFTSLSRNRGSATLEADVLAVQDNFCLKCHDSDGATATHFSGNALRPFSSGNTDVADVSASFSTGNNFFHPVLGYKDNPNCNSTTMVSPWTGASSQRISCFDCHETVGHGDANQRMLLDAIDFDTMESTTDKANLPAGMGATVDALCIRCHDAGVYISGNAGSAFEYHGASQNQHGAAGGNELGCMGCHGGVVDLSGLSSNGAARGNIHGGSFTWPSDSDTSGVATQAFSLGGWLSGWERGTDRRGNPEGHCNGGDCNHSNGQTYTYDVLD